MRLFILVSICFLSLSAYAQSVDVDIAALDKARLPCPAGPPQEAAIRNPTNKRLGVAVIDAATGRQVRGFGMGSRTNVVVAIGEGEVLTLTNNSTKKVKVQVRFDPRPAAPVVSGEERSIGFTFHNTSARSIPLIIPGIMNPNLSPFSKSGVSLPVGQQVFFRCKGRQELLFVVDNSFSNGQTLDIPALIRKRSKELAAAGTQ
jgi:hypothetical protein